MSHYKLAAGRDPLPFIEAVETFSNKGGMLPEQLWDANDLPEGKMKRRGPTGSQVGWHLVPYSYFCGKRDGKKIFRWGLLRQFQSGKRHEQITLAADNNDGSWRSALPSGA